MIVGTRRSENNYLGIDKILRSKFLVNIFIYIHHNFKMGRKLKSEKKYMFIILKQ